MNEIRENLRTFILNNFLFGDDPGLDDSTSFRAAGIMDSTGVLELITFLEQSYSIKVKDEELTPENLDSIGNVMVYLGKKLGSDGEGGGSLHAE